MNVKIGFAVILPLHDFHLGGQTKVAYIKNVIKYKLLSIKNEEYKILVYLIISVNFVLFLYICLSIVVQSIVFFFYFFLFLDFS